MMLAKSISLSMMSTKPYAFMPDKSTLKHVALSDKIATTKHCLPWWPRLSKEMETLAVGLEAIQEEFESLLTEAENIDEGDAEAEKLADVSCSNVR